MSYTLLMKRFNSLSYLVEYIECSSFCQLSTYFQYLTIKYDWYSRTQANQLINQSAPWSARIQFPQHRNLCNGWDIYNKKCHQSEGFFLMFQFLEKILPDVDNFLLKFFSSQQILYWLHQMLYIQFQISLSRFHPFQCICSGLLILT